MDAADDAQEDTAPLSITERLQGKRTNDIRLPMPEGGRRDPKLPKATAGETIQEGLDQAKDIARRVKRSNARPRRRS